MPAKGFKSRSLVITPLGNRILRAVERGTYKFSDYSRPNNGKRRGRKMRRRK